MRPNTYPAFIQTQARRTPRVVPKGRPNRKMREEPLGRREVRTRTGNQMDGWYIYFLMYTGAYGAVFIFIHCIARSLSPKPWSDKDALVVCWGIIYGFTALFYGYPASMLSDALQLPVEAGEFVGAISAIGIPSLITVLITASAWRSKPVAWSIGVGTLLACSISLLTDENGAIFVAPVVWNFSYMLGCCVQNTKDMKLVPENHCDQCGYDLFGLKANTICPECGHEANRVPLCPECGQEVLCIANDSEFNEQSTVLESKPNQ